MTDNVDSDVKISVVTPSFNQGPFIEQTIESVLSQKACFSDFEYIVMDGGSTDETLQILKKYHQCFAWTSEPDHGQAHAVNKGIQCAKGDIIGWLNSDDIYYPGILKTVSDFFEANPGVDVLYGDAALIDGQGKPFGRYLTEKFSLRRLKARCFISQPAAFFRSSAILKYGLLNESLDFCMDYEYWLRLALSGACFAYLPQKLAAARVHSGAKSTHSCLPASAEAIVMLRQKLGYIPATLLVSYAGAAVKSASGEECLSLRFIPSVWAGLWRVSGMHYQGSKRVIAWFAAQWAMLSEFLIRSSRRLLTGKSE